MSEFLSIRNFVYFRHLLDAVHPFFWPALYWQLKRAWLCLQRENLNSVLLAVTWWGGVRIVHRGKKIAVAATNPFALTKPRFDHPVWSTSVPACLGTPAPDIPILPRSAGHVSPKVTERAQAHVDTS